MTQREDQALSAGSFAVGRTIFAESAAAWTRGEWSDDEAIATMADNYRRLCLIWDEARLKGNVYE